MKKAHIITFGCQMNQHDSNRMIEILQRENYQMTDQIEQSDLIIINTCSVRDNPENKVYSHLGRLRRFKEKNSQLLIGVGGCVAQQEGESILKREPVVDFVFGTDNYMYLADILKKAKEGKRYLQIEKTKSKNKILNFIPEPDLTTGHVDGCKAYIAITKGCDNFCSFCVVPYTRGREVSRELSNIIIEAQDLINKGAKEITLLGQNVNSYRAGDHDFYDLLNALSHLTDLHRIRFTSPHPKDWNDQLSDLMAAKPSICNQLHLPFQAGSNHIVKAMRRGHTIEEYLKKIDYVREKIPDVALSTDLIVGFPGETEEDFLQTLEILKRVKYYKVYSFKYSPRPYTRASKMVDNVTRKEKEDRLSRVLALQATIQDEYLENCVNKNVDILIDTTLPHINAVKGRTVGDIPVTLFESAYKIGDIVTVQITDRRRHTLISNRVVQLAS